jgi:hypothetical protein
LDLSRSRRLAVARAAPRQNKMPIPQGDRLPCPVSKTSQIFVSVVLAVVCFNLLRPGRSRVASVQTTATPFTLETETVSFQNDPKGNSLTERL